MRKYGARVWKSPGFRHHEKRAHKADTTELFEVLEPFKVSQFTVRAGCRTKEISGTLKDIG
jgi:hypothetical protein